MQGENTPQSRRKSGRTLVTHILIVNHRDSLRLSLFSFSSLLHGFSWGDVHTDQRNNSTQVQPGEPMSLQGYVQEHWCGVTYLYAWVTHNQL